MTQFVTFLQCYFQSEHFPVDLLAASEQCQSVTFWEVVKACAVHPDTFVSFATDVRVTQDLRPLPVTEQSLGVILNAQYSRLAAVDLEKALCRINVRLKIILVFYFKWVFSNLGIQATNIWSCASTIQYKEPSVQFFYMLETIIDLSELQALLDTTSTIDILPNPNELARCQTAALDPLCFNYYFHVNYFFLTFKQ